MAKGFEGMTGGRRRPRKRLSAILGFEQREASFARTLRLCLAISIASHALTFLVVGRYVEEPAPFNLIGYEGPTMIMTEISILEEREAGS